MAINQRRIVGAAAAFLIALAAFVRASSDGAAPESVDASGKDDDGLGRLLAPVFGQPALPPQATNETKEQAPLPKAGEATDSAAPQAAKEKKDKDNVSGQIEKQSTNNVAAPAEKDMKNFALPPIVRESSDIGPERELRNLQTNDSQRPPALKRPLEPPDLPLAPKLTEEQPVAQAPFDSPLGFAGPSGILPREAQTDPHFIPVEDRWRIGFPDWTRYAAGTATPDADAPYQVGHWYDPYNQNVLKGDYPILGQHTFFVLTATSQTLFEPHQVPIGTTAFESTARPGEANFFGRPNQEVFSQYFTTSFELFHGDAGFRPVDWRVKVTPVFNINDLSADEVAVVNPDVRRGGDRTRTYVSLEEWFAEAKISDLSPNYDFVSVRVGSQPFVSDFRGFIFSDVNRAVRIFGNLDSNREQFNVIYFDQLEKDTNSDLNTFHDRHQQIVVANYFVQDFIWPGYTAQSSITYNHDSPTFKFDNNDFLVRPDPIGAFTPHTLDVVYLGWAGDGHINQFNIDHAFYWAVGRDSFNPMANQGQDISAVMGAIELSYDRDWLRFRTSAFYSSGDENPHNGHATGFDSIMDDPNFAGGEFSYWQRQAIRLLGVNLVQRESLIPDLRSSKIQGQSNFVNPGLILFNFGVDAELTPKARLINNINFLWFDTVEPLQILTYQQHIDNFIGIDISSGVEYRPLLNNNVIVTAGVSSLVPGRGFSDLYDNQTNRVTPLFAAFIDLVLRY